MLPHVLNKFKDIFEKNLTIVKKIKEKKVEYSVPALILHKTKKKKNTTPPKDKS